MMPLLTEYGAAKMFMERFSESQGEGNEGAVPGAVLRCNQAGKDEGKRYGADSGGVRWDVDGVAGTRGGGTAGECTQRRAQCFAMRRPFSFCGGLQLS